ncbi:epimerase [Sphingomonas oligophenolica]|uniref:NAD(P)H-binding protein n=1 Tax=Sphingomonas oligophenolica TaxID=301154 RepID=A0ABU9Y132_9SPHN
MKVLIFGATGMVGQGVLRECLRDAAVERVVTVGRTATGRKDPKLEEIVLADLFAVQAVQDRLRGFDACFFCLGVSAVGMSEADYTRITHDLTVTIAALLVRLNPGMTFVYVTGAGTDTSERGRFMWARVKGRTENALSAMPFRATFMFRPGFIQPLNGIVSKTAWYRAAYAITAPISGLLGRIAPAAVTTTENVGRAMIAVALNGYAKPVLGNEDINRVATRRR